MIRDLPRMNADQRGLDEQVALGDGKDKHKIQNKMHRSFDYAPISIGIKKIVAALRSG